MTYQVQLIDALYRPAAVVRRRTDFSDLPTLIPKALDEVYAFLRAGAVPHWGINLAVYFPEAMAVEIGVEVAGPFTPRPPILCSSTPAGPAATTAHFGAYSDLGSAHDAVRQWCAEQGKTLAGPNWEIYGHWDDDPSKVRTDVFYLLR